MFTRDSIDMPRNYCHEDTVVYMRGYVQPLGVPSTLDLLIGVRIPASQFPPTEIREICVAT
jgi:hypothetical protein